MTKVIKTDLKLDAEEKLVQDLQAGSEQAFSALVDLYQNKALSTCLGFIPNRQDAEDVVQEVFVEVFRSVGNFKGESKLSSWIYRIVVNKSLEALRYKKRKKRKAFFQSLIGLNEQNGSLDGQDFDHPGVLMENKERSMVLFSKIDELPESQRVVFTLCKLDDLSYREAAEIMKTSVSSVESLMFRAKKNLQKNLEDYYKNEKI
ncbi:MAG: sigma-70 family RNA polymerase sigma factor [Saprospiraceae bacterium]|nr:sigma-70 family RNA polymerase sigma factor [Saprospiraceae bacterium]